jgi:hypothetical protein
MKYPQATTATITNKSLRASLQLTHKLRGYIRQMRSRAPTEKCEHHQHRDHSAEPERDSLTPSQAWGLLMRARLGPPLTARLSPLKQQDIPTPLTM